MSDSKMGTKTCPDCGLTKALTDFPRNASRADGYGRYCKDCYAIRYRRHRERKAAAAGKVIKEKRAVPAGSKYCPRCETVMSIERFGSNRSARDGLTAYCRPCHNAKVRESKDRNGGWREYHLRQRYGIGQAEVDAMLAEQDGLCAACRTDKPAHVDHDHNSGRVRGMLCFLCNQALGNVRDDVDRLQGLIRYLVRSRLAATVTEVEQPCCVIELNQAALHAA